ncbi:hypothetical protein [uncultured Aliivibrio sp.]|uniref:hypothetical protein n=1 Tax=uncultured Aliivibrio sp. TaxID=873085 RepID=UPI002634A5E2|nr:hypothetical protein [uncultured Aliivibrio sp.]
MKMLTQYEKQQILARHITSANGRPREMLEVMQEAYPTPISKAYICHQLSMSGEYAFRSVLRNAGIFIDIEVINEPDKPTMYRLGSQCIQSAQIRIILQTMAN